MKYKYWAHPPSFLVISGWGHEVDHPVTTLGGLERVLESVRWRESVRELHTWHSPSGLHCVGWEGPIRANIPSLRAVSGRGRGRRDQARTLGGSDLVLGSVWGLEVVRELHTGHFGREVGCWLLDLEILGHPVGKFRVPPTWGPGGNP